MILLLSTTAASADMKIFEADEDGVVNIPENQSFDQLEHNLVEIETDGAAAVQMFNNATTFTILDYRNGLFDIMPKTMYTITNTKIAAIDNDLVSAATLSPSESNKIRINFNRDVTVNAIYFHSTVRSNYRFYKDGSQIFVYNTGNEIQQKYDLITPITINSILIEVDGNVAGTIREFEIFGEINVDYIAISELEVKEITQRAANVTYKNPDSEFFKDVEVILNDNSVYRGSNAAVYLSDLSPNTEYKVTVRAHYQDGNYIDTHYSFTTTKETIPPTIENIAAVFEKNNGEINLTYQIKNQDYVKIYKDNKLIADNVTASSYTDKNIEENKTYVYKVVAVNEFGQSDSSVTIETTVDPPKQIEVTNLRAVPKDYRVDLSWTLPQYEDFHHVKIYRAKKQEPSNFLMRMASFFMASEPVFDPIFETNGTYLNDLTVLPDNQYTYKLTSVDTNDVESDGITIDVQTLKSKIAGESQEKNENGDFIYKWETPTNGNVKVLIGGVEYATVPASDKQITIPKADAGTLDVLGNPDITLVPISEEGKEGVVVAPGKGNSSLDKSDLTAANLLKAGVALLGVVGAFVLLGLAFRFVPKLVDLIRNTFLSKQQRNKDDEIALGRRSSK